MAYVGQTRGRWLTARLMAAGIGECTVRGELPPRRVPFFYDNGAFGDWKAQRPFDAVAFREDLASLRKHRLVPDFVVAPDVVAGGESSLVESLRWLDECRSVGPVYLAVQDGMGLETVRASVDGFAGLFVGGTLEWKLSTGQSWCRLAHELGLACHVGRVGSARRIRWAQRIGADSIDSALPLWSDSHMRRFLSALRHEQGDLFAEVA